MKVISEDFKKFFRPPARQDRRPGQPAQQPLGFPGQEQPGGQADRAQPGQIAAAAHRQPHSVIAPEQPVACPEGHRQQRPAQPGPEQQIQRQPCPPAREAPAQNPQQVIAQPRPQAQRQAQPQAPGLEENVRLHPAIPAAGRRSRPSPWAPRRSGTPPSPPPAALPRPGSAARCAGAPPG